MRAVFFDLDGTLVELPDDFAALFEAALADHGVRADAERHEFYTDALFDHLGACHDEPYRAAMADLRAAYDLDPSASALAETYTQREAAATDLRPGVRDALDALAAGDCTLGVLTNGGARAQRRKLAHHDLSGYFDAVVVSGDVGAGKPDPDIFAAARDAIPADEYAFVADDLERDVRPAQDVGFTGVHVTEDVADEGERSAESRERRPDVAVTSLRDVPDLFA
ncbi:HAD family hydrolase [Halorussus sp. MSC15.2]|uniref:HAD family hydrolase n=1 Tax=Halorussus sp. MSC15.2 TaxID=2283638 RepID=UPI0013CF89A8|nr:HAD family hydrolase [Halorussus sp. MSC15.2]NEU57475.1 HAD family hydrolase [Halorussus sp. MSC15.2]